MKKINGRYYRKFKGWTGKRYLVEVPFEEVLAKDVYRLTVVITPLITIVLMAWAAGLI